MSLRWKIAAAVAAIAALATVAVGLLSYRATQDRLLRELDASLVSAVDLAGDRRGPDWGGGGGPGAAFYQAQVLGTDGQVLRRPPTWEPSEAARRAVGRPRLRVIETTTIGGDRYRALTVGAVNGAYQVARPLDEVDRVLRSLRARTAVLVALVTVGAALVGSLIAARVTSTLRRLTVAAETVGATGRFDVAVPSDGSDEVSRLGVAFGSMLDSLDRSRAEQRRLVQDAGHELRTPLTSLRTNLDVLRRHPDLSADDRRQIVTDLHAETEELVALVEEIVTVAGGVATDEHACELSLGDLVRGVAERVGRRTGRRITVVADESPVVAQQAGVERAVSNLLDNATKFDDSGGPVEVTVAAGVVEVADRGPGIPDAELPHVFERFHRAAASQSMPGSGLGLSIVHDVVRRNGGNVFARTRDGGGAVVGFRLPLAPPAPP